MPSTIAKTVEKATTFKFQPEVILQDLSPPVISTIARALVSEGVGGEHIEVQE